MDARTVKNLENVDKRLDAIIRQEWPQIVTIGEKFGCIIKIVCGYRSQAEQDRLYRIGRRGIAGERKVTWTKSSKHTRSPSQAIDFGIFKNGKYVDDVDPRTARKIYVMISAHMSKHKIIKWGGEFGDDPHFEIRTVTP